MRSEPVGAAGFAGRTERSEGRTLNMSERVVCDIDELRTLFLFEKLTDEQLQWLCERGGIESHDAGEVIREGEPATCFYVLLEGTISLARRVGVPRPQAIDGAKPLLSRSSAWLPLMLPSCAMALMRKAPLLPKLRVTSAVPRLTPP